MGKRGRSVDSCGQRNLPFPSAPRGISDENWRLLLACGESLSAHIEGRRRPIWPPLSALVLAAAGLKPSDDRPWQREPHADEASAAALVLRAPETAPKFKSLGKAPSVALACLAIGAARYVYGGEVRPVGNLRALFGLFEERADKWHELADSLFTYASGKKGLLALSATDTALTALDGAVEVTPKALGALLGIPPPVLPEPEEVPIDRWMRRAQNLRPGLRGSSRPAPAPQDPSESEEPPQVVDISSPTTRLENVVLSSELKDEITLAVRLHKRSKGKAKILMLFEGAAGTGKTHAAGAFAKAIGKPLATLSLARLRSRWLGQSEKNLEGAFRQAEEAGAVLLLDEVDAVLRGREYASQAHELALVNTLLKALEEPRVPVILATNLRPCLDEAVMRRLTACLTFPLPSAGEREALWAVELKRAGIKQPLDTQRLAGLVLSGGLIRNACQHLANRCLLLGKKFEIDTEAALSAGLREASKMPSGGTGGRVLGFRPSTGPLNAPQEVQR